MLEQPFWKASSRNLEAVVSGAKRLRSEPQAFDHVRRCALALSSRCARLGRALTECWCQTCFGTTAFFEQISS